MNYDFTENSTSSYNNFMGTVGGMLELKLDTKNPVEVRDFGKMLNSVAVQYDEFVTETYGEQKTDARFYIQEIKKGSIIVEFAAVSIGMMDQAIILKQFVEITKSHVGAYLGAPNLNSRKTTPKKGDHLVDMVRAVANSEDGTLTLAYKESDSDGSGAALMVTKGDAETLTHNVFQNPNPAPLMLTVDEDNLTRARGIMRLYQHNQDPKAASKKRTNHKAIFRDVDNKPRPLTYDSDALATELSEIVSENPYGEILLDVDYLLVKEGSDLRSYRLAQIHNWFMDDEELL